LFGEFRHGAELALREIVGGDSEDAIETGAGVFPGDDRGQFDELGLGKVLAECRVEFVGDVGWGAGEGHSQVKDGFFAGIEVRAGFELREVLELVFGDAGCSAHGRMDINSKRTADHQGSLELGDFLQVQGDEALGGAVNVEARCFAQIFGDEGADTDAERDATETAFHEIEKQAGKGTGLVV
jgi:hypothetical protein